VFEYPGPGLDFIGETQGIPYQYQERETESQTMIPSTVGRDSRIHMQFLL
jgi:hypothetical protein